MREVRKQPVQSAGASTRYTGTGCWRLYPVYRYRVLAPIPGPPVQGTGASTRSTGTECWFLHPVHRYRVLGPLPGPPVQSAGASIRSTGTVCWCLCPVLRSILCSQWIKHTQTQCVHLVIRYSVIYWLIKQTKIGETYCYMDHDLHCICLNPVWKLT